MLEAALRGYCPKDDGMRVKRPLLVGDGFVLVGFKEDEWKARIWERMLRKAV